MANKVEIVYTADGNQAISETDAVGASQKRLASDSASVTSTIKDGWVKVTAQYYLAKEAYTKMVAAMELVELGAKVRQTEDTFSSMAATMHFNGEGMITDMERLTKNTVDASDLMQKSIKGLAQGLSSSDMKQIAEMAPVAAKNALISVNEAFERLSDAIANEIPRSLRQMGMLTKDEMNLVNRAITSGVDNVDLLTLAHANLQVQMARMGPAAVSDYEKFQQLSARTKEFHENVGKLANNIAQTLIPALNALFDILNGKSTVGPDAMLKGIDNEIAQVEKTIKMRTAISNVPGVGLLAQNPDNPFSNERLAALNQQLDALGKQRQDILRKYFSHATTTKQAYKSPEDAEAERKAQEDAIKAQLAAAGNASKAKELASSMEDFRAKVDQMNPSLGELDKKMTDVYETAYKLGQKGASPEFLQEGIDAALAYTNEASQKAFENVSMDFIIERKTGFDKDLANVDKWLYDQVIKIGANEEQQNALIQMWSDKRAAILQAEHNKEAAGLRAYQEAMIAAQKDGHERDLEEIRNSLNRKEELTNAFYAGQLQNMESTFSLLSQGSQYAGDFANPLDSALAMQKDSAVYDLKLQQLNDYYQRRLTAMANAGTSEQALQDEMNTWDLQSTLMTQQLKLQTYQNTSNLIMGTVSAIGSVIGKNNTALFLLQKAAAIAITIVNAHAASMAALAPPPLGLGPIFGAPLAASMLTYGYIQAGLIAATAIGQLATGGSSAPSASTSGGSATTATSSSGSSQDQSQQQRTLTVNIHINGDVLNSYDELARKLIPALNEAIGDKVILQT